MESTFFIITSVSLALSLIFAIFWTGYQSVIIEILKDYIIGSFATSANPRPPIFSVIKHIKPQKKFLLNLSKTQQTIILTSLSLAAATSITMMIFVIFGENNAIYMIIGTITSIFQSFMIPVAFILDRG